LGLSHISVGGDRGGWSSGGSVIGMGKSKKLRIPAPEPLPSTTNLTKSHPGLNPRLRGEKPAKDKVIVTLRLAAYRKSIHLGAKPLESYDERFFFPLNPCGHSPCVTSSLTRGWPCQVYVSHM
jgi:hypothetical protein